MELYIIKIIALNFNVNFDTLNAALYRMPVATRTATILTDEEHKNLAELAGLVRKAQLLLEHDRKRQSHPPAWTDTIPGHWVEEGHSSLINPMRMFRRTIDKVSPNEDIKRVLQEALEDVGEVGDLRCCVSATGTQRHFGGCAGGILQDWVIRLRGCETRIEAILLGLNRPLSL
jgi:hypothetical protein